MNIYIKTFLLIAFMFHFSRSASARGFARGADVSWLPEMEDSGRVFLNKKGEAQMLLGILQDQCINAIRIRVWLNPANGVCNKDYVVNLASRAYSMGFNLMIDFHYSDWWADPINQKTPVDWQYLSVSQLKDSVYAHTFNVLSALKQAGITPQWVQIGNETNDGMLWENGRASASMANYAMYVTAGHLAAHAVFPRIISIVHLGSGDDQGLYEWNIGGLISNGAKFEAIGMSLYPETDSWQESTIKCQANMKYLINTFRKPIMVSEIGMPWSSPKESKAFVEKMAVCELGLSLPLTNSNRFLFVFSKIL